MSSRSLVQYAKLQKTKSWCTWSNVIRLTLCVVFAAGVVTGFSFLMRALDIDMDKENKVGTATPTDDNVQTGLVFRTSFKNGMVPTYSSTDPTRIVSFAVKINEHIDMQRNEQPFIQAHGSNCTTLESYTYPLPALAF